MVDALKSMEGQFERISPSLDSEVFAKLIRAKEAIPSDYQIFEVAVGLRTIHVFNFQLIFSLKPGNGPRAEEDFTRSLSAQRGASNISLLLAPGHLNS